MAENIISPGVFTRENDLSFLPQGVGSIGAAIVGPTEKGPAFVPTVVRSFAEYERRFGPLSSETYIPQTVREYLRSAGSVTVCRVLAGGGYTFANGTNEFVALGISGSNDNILTSVIFPSKNLSTPDLGSTTLVNNSSVSNKFRVTLAGTNVTTTKFTASLNPANTDYFPRQLGYNPNNSKTATNAYAGTPGYSYLDFKQLNQDFSNATTKEVFTITLLGAADATINTSSLQNVALAASGSFYLKTPDGVSHTIGFNTTTNAAAATQLSGSVTEVTIDTLTGESTIDQVDILQDAGKAINPALELGQIEGGFVQGQGWLTMEEVIWKPNGQITTVSPSTYKIPAVSDMPKKFNVEIFKQGKNIENVVNKSKTTGEPPLMLAMSVFFAIKDAIASTSKYKEIPILDAPATPEKILMSLKKL